MQQSLVQGIELLNVGKDFPNHVLWQQGLGRDLRIPFERLQDNLSDTYMLKFFQKRAIDLDTFPVPPSFCTYVISVSSNSRQSLCRLERFFARAYVFFVCFVLFCFVLFCFVFFFFFFGLINLRKSLICFFPSPSSLSDTATCGQSSDSAQCEPRWQH